MLLESTVKPVTYLHIEHNWSHRPKNLVAIAFLVQILKISSSSTYSSSWGSIYWIYKSMDRISSSEANGQSAF